MRKKYTYDIVKAEALKYTTRSEFRKKSNGHYDAAKRLGIYEEVCSHMVRIQKKPFSEEEGIRRLAVECASESQSKWS